MEKRQPIIDPILFGLVLITSLLGIFFIFDAGYPREMSQGRSPFSGLILSQIMALIVGLVLWIWIGISNPAKWMKASAVLWALSALSLVLCHVPGLAYPQNGAYRWFKLPLIPPIQPAEFVKFTTVLFLAALLANREPWKAKPARDVFQWLDLNLKRKLTRIFPAILVCIAAYVIEREPDLGTAAVVLVICAAMFATKGMARSSWVIGILVLGAGLVAMTKTASYRMERIANHERRWDPGVRDDVGYQSVVAIVGYADGGVGGVGPGNGRAKHVIPAATTDYILATISEEFGFVGAVGVLALLCGIGYRLFWLGERAKSSFGKLMACGAGTWIGVQSVVNFTMANGAIPPIGIPLPFVSSGGSSLIGLFLVLGVTSAALAYSPAMEGAVAPRRNRWRHGRPRFSRA